MGRKKILIDWARVDRYLKAQTPGTAIADALGIHRNTLYAACEREHKCDFSAYSAQKRLQGLELLRLTQFDKAMSGQTSMLIWLGKQYLGQSDKAEIEQGEILVTVKREYRTDTTNRD